MVTTIRKTKEKGQRTPRSMDSYEETGGFKGAIQCGCGAVFKNKRWYSGDLMEAVPAGHKHVCPACRRIADNNPAGIVSLKGSFFATREEELTNLIRHIELTTLKKNPLGRIIESRKEKDGYTITTTDGKLAQKIGRDLFKSHGGELHFHWNQAEELVRVNWRR
jgi:hypothetical protein